MPMEIAGLLFQGFPGYDSGHLHLLGYRDRVRWLRYRMAAVLCPNRRSVPGERLPLTLHHQTPCLLICESS